MRARSLAVGCLLAAGCYDVGQLSGSFVDDGGMRDAAPDAGGQPTWHALPAPTQAALRGVFGSGTGDVFAAGASSTIVRLGASAAPQLESTPPGFELRAVWASAGSALAVGDESVVLQRSGASWSGNTMLDATLFGVIGLDAGEVVVVGSGGTLLDRLGTWIVDDSGVITHLRGVSARAAADLLVAGDAGVILHGSGSPLAWTAEVSGSSADLFAVFATPGDSFVVGAGGVVLHAGATDAWASEPSGTSADLFGVFGAGGEVWAVGAGGIIVHRRGGAWSVERSGGADLHAVWASGPADVWAVGDTGTILHRTP